MSPFMKISVPDGMGEAMESLTRAILENQPEDIYTFAFKHFQSLIKIREAQTSGLSPSSTEESNSKGPAPDVASNDDRKTSISNQEDKPPEEPESNDTSYGVEATAVRTLAASTGTVAILGTTAQSQSQKDLRKTDDSPEPSQPQQEDVKLTKTDDKTGVPDASESKNEKELKSADLESVRISVEPPQTPDSSPPEEVKNEVASDSPNPTESKVENTTLPNVDKEAKIEIQESIKSPEEVNTEIAKSPDELTKDTQDVKPNESQETEAIVKKEEPSEEKIAESPANEKPAASATPPAVTNVVEAQVEKSDETLPKNVKQDSTIESPSQTPIASPEAPSKVPEEIISKEEKTVIVDKVEDIEKSPEEVTTSSKDEQNDPKKTDELSSPGQDENSESLSGENDVSLPSANTRTNEEEDNDISSEQLKTNSLSDVSMSETVQSEVEEKSETGGLTTPTADSINKGLITEAISPMIEVNSPSENSDKNISDPDKTPDIAPDSKNDFSSSEEKITNVALTESPDLNAAATTIQSNIRGFLTRKQLKSSQNSSSEDISKKMTDSMIDKIKDEVDEICKEAEKTTESLISSPDINTDAIIPNDEFPAPPDDMLTDKVDETLDDDKTKTSLNSQPIVPSSASQKQAQDAKEQKTDAKSAETKKQNTIDVEPPPPDLDDNSAADSDQLPNDEDLPAPDFEMLESSYTDDINTEIINDLDKATNAEEDHKDSTEGDLTIDEDSDKLLKDLQKPQECDELRNAANEIVERTEKEIDNAATKIQAGVRGYLTRKQQNVKNTQENGDKSPEKLQSPTDNKPTEDNANGKNEDKAVWNTLEKEINEAATTIQANFRGYMARKEGKNTTTEESDNKEQSDTTSSTSETQPSIKEELPKKSPAPQETANDLSKTVQKEKEDSGGNNSVETNGSAKDSASPISDDLINDSAVKIQAGVRGYLVRKRQQAEKDAAVKIQAGFKGYKVRQQVKDQN